MTTTIWLIDNYNLPESFISLCREYSIVTLLQALELIQRLQENPSLLPENITLQMLGDIRAQLIDIISPETLEQLTAPFPYHPINGLLEGPLPNTIEDSGERSLSDFFEDDNNLINRKEG